jgi:hypothetical protein
MVISRIGGVQVSTDVGVADDDPLMGSQPGGGQDGDAARSSSSSSAPSAPETGQVRAELTSLSPEARNRHIKGERTRTNARLKYSFKIPDCQTSMNCVPEKQACLFKVIQKSYWAIRVEIENSNSSLDDSIHVYFTMFFFNIVVSLD